MILATDAGSVFQSLMKVNYIITIHNGVNGLQDYPK